MVTSAETSTTKLELVRRANPYLRSYIQSLRSRGLIRRATLRDQYLICQTRSRGALPKSVSLDTPLGRVDLLIHCAPTREEYGVVRQLYSLKPRDRARLFAKYPELGQLQFPTDKRLLRRLINDLADALKPRTWYTPPGEEPDVLP
jgi:hypothetical protein